jgi:hypothetical protein
MDSRQQATHDALHQIDPDLAGLFAGGCELIDRIDEPGVRYVVGHIGRELSNAVLDVIARELPEVPGEAGPDPPPKTEATLRQEIAAVFGVELDDPRIDKVLDTFGEDQRLIIARALNLGQRHPLVGAWLKLHGRLVAVTHYRRGGTAPSARVAREAFEALAELLFSRVGPYFKTQDDLDALLRIESPTGEDVSRLRHLLVRPQLRFRFFQTVRNVGWLQSLALANAFDHPPEWRQTKTGHRLVGWPEGECLVRFSTKAPDLVVDALLRVPDDLENPVVWRIIAQAVQDLPIESARQLVAKLAKALRRTRVEFFQHQSIEAAIRLASAGEPSAFRLTEALLDLKPLPKDDDADEMKWFRFRPEDMLRGIDEYQLNEILSRVIPALVVVNRKRTWSMLLGLLRKAQRLVAEAGFGDVGSDQWCPSLDSEDSHGDVRAQLAVAAMSVVRKTASESPGEILEFLEDLPDDGGLFTRMRLAVLTFAGSQAQAELDRVIADPKTLDPDTGTREIAALLRARFGSASPEARRAFVQALEAGPAEEVLRRIAEWEGADPESPEARQGALERWQAKRLRRFHDRIPADLAAMAERLGVKSEKPSFRDQALEERGYFVESGSRGEASPKAAAELEAMTPAALLAYLDAWQPTGAFDQPSRQGLAGKLTALISENPINHVEFLRAASAHSSIHPVYRAAILRGLMTAVDRNKGIPWSEAIDLANATIARADTERSGSEREDWAWARREAALLVQEGCSRDLAPMALRTEIFRTVEMAVLGSPQWTDSDDDPPSNFGDIVSARNDDGGFTTMLMIAAAWWAYRADGNSSSKIAGQLRSWLELIRARGDHGRISARVQIGAFLPQLLLLDREWVLAHAEDFLGSGMDEPLTNPTWGGYLVLGQFYSSSFDVLRPWFVRHAGDLGRIVAAEAADPDENREWRVGRHFIEKVGIAFLQGRVALGQDDHLLEDVFGVARAEDLTHFYWQIRRGWSELDKSPGDDLIERVLALWAWRLDELEGKPPSDQVAEEADGLGWLIVTPYLPDGRVLPLAARTVALDRRKTHTRGMTWARFAELGALDAKSVIDMADNLIKTELASDYAVFDFKDVAPVLRLGLASADPTVKARTEQLIHDLGDSGWTEFGVLLQK